METLRHFLDPKFLIQWGGYPVLMAIIFAETGLLVGFFLPGDSLLVTAGVFVNADLVNPMALAPFVNLLVMNVVLMVMAITGDAIGYAFGAKAGQALFQREQTKFFRKDHLIATQAFYEKHGGKTIILARFMPFARTFAPIVAGVGGMPYRKFAMFNVVGAVAWVSSMTFLGYFLGKVFDAKQIERVVYLIIVISVSPLAIGWLRSRKGAGEAASG
jgi:membrane-associated protein